MRATLELREVVTMGDTPAIKVLVAYDGSVAAGAAIEACARLLPGASARVAHVWTPPYAGESLRRRLWRGAARDQEAALVAVGSRGRGAVREILLGSVAMGTLHRAHRLVMLVPRPGRPHPEPITP